MDANGSKRKRSNLSLLPDMRLDRLLGERKLSRNHHCRHRQLRRPEFPRAHHRRVGGVSPFLALVAVRHATQANAETGVTKQPAYQHDDCPTLPMHVSFGAFTAGSSPVISTV